jgi:hypothetical protein
MEKVPASFGTGTRELLAVVGDAKRKYPSVESWGANGLCWGGKVS